MVYVDFEDGRGFISVDAKIFDPFMAVYSDGYVNSDGWSEYLCGYCNCGFGGIESVERFDEIEDMFDEYPYYR